LCKGRKWLGDELRFNIVQRCAEYLGWLAGCSFDSGSHDFYIVLACSPVDGRASVMGGAVCFVRASW
jgi:hypothetical protein